MGYSEGAIIAPGLKCSHKRECYKSVDKKHDGKHNKFDSKNGEVKISLSSMNA